MSEETPAILTDPLTDPAAPRLALGAALRTARKRLEMSIDEAAHQLRMSPRQVLALEEDNLEALNSPAFVRGFIRNYARLLKLEPEPLLEAHRAMQPNSDHNAAISLQSERIAISDGSRKTWLLYVLASFLVVVLGSGWLLYKDWGAQQQKKTIVAEKSKVTEPSPAPAQPVEMLPVMPALAVTPATQAPVTGVTPNLSTATTTKGAIRMVFSEQTWVSVVDSTGKEVFNKTKAAGTEDTADGIPPFNVVIGNANGVKVFFRDQPYDIAPYTKGNVARLKLE